MCYSSLGSGTTPPPARIGLRVLAGRLQRLRHAGRLGDTRLSGKTDGKADGRGIRALVEQGRDALCCTALWTMHVWIYWFNLTPLRSEMSAGPWLDIYGVMAVALALACVRSLRRSESGGDAGHDGRDTHLDLAMTVLMCSCTASVVAQGMVGIPQAAWSAANVTAAGICMGWGYARWFSHYADLGIRLSVLCLFLSYLIGSSLKIALDMLPAIVGSLFALALPVISLLCLRRAEAGRPHAPEGARGQIIYPNSRETFSSLTRVAACVFTFCLLRGIVPTDNDFGAGSALVSMASHTIEVAFSIVVLAWVIGMGRSLDFPQLWRFVFLFLSTALALSALGVAEEAVSLCMHVVASLIVMLLWLALADIAHHSDVRPTALFGFGWGAYALTTYLGRVARATVLSDAGERILFGQASITAVTCVASLWALGIVMVFCLETRDPDVQRIFADLRGGVTTPEEFASIDSRCEQIAASCGLTQRELDVFRLLARGRSKNFIAEELSISENTVRGHARNVYAKLGVHTRDELQNKLES